ncbi:MAG: 5-methylthioadenosine/adenosylhomocysteine nucleosidase [Paucimonas sp.]|jgi:adenosylhomocysteine nucleosidase|nr:5-methylthioadenosine/adenosylhomocysteine nucleosidase [Paucimonas sp.]
MNTRPLRLGIISALHQEQAGLVEAMHQPTIIQRGMRDYACGPLWDVDCVCVLSRIGKVAAAGTAATLIERFDVTHIVFTGVAGGAAKEIAVGDIVVADSLVQHDMDATPLFPRFEIPLTGLAEFPSDASLTAHLRKAATDFLEVDFQTRIAPEDREQFGLASPRMHCGMIASGDEFIDNRERMIRLKTALPATLAVEMEGAAVAQVCFEFGIPYAVIRTISDGANEDSPVDFMRFIDRVSSRYAHGIMARLCDTLAKAG